MNIPIPREKFKRRAVVALTVATAVSLALGACAGSAPTAPSGAEIDPDAIIEAGISYALSGAFDPMLTTDAVTLSANWHTMEGLTELDPATREVYAALGKELPQQRDDLTWSVDVREGATFHNGDAVTIDDVVFSFERVLDPENLSLYAGFIDFIEGVEAEDEDTVVFHLKYPFSLVPERLSVVKVVPKKLVEADYAAFDALPTGTGPYRITSAVPEDRLTFERFDDYNGPRPAKAAGMTWYLLGDSAARVTALSAGTVQAIEDIPYIDIPMLEQELMVESAQAFGLLFMMFNTDKKPFDDPRVRQAFFYALDMDKIINTGLLGNAKAATSFLPETHRNYHEASTVYSYDPDKARQLLKDAGVDGLDFNLWSVATGWVADIAPLIKEDLDAVGVKTNLLIASGLYAKVDAGEMDVMIAPGDPSVFGDDPDVLLRWWYGDNVWSQSRYRWNDTPEFAELSKLLDSAVQATGDEQQKTWNEAFDLISEQVPLYPLFHRQLPTGWDADRLVGFKPIPLPGLSFLDVGVAKK